MFVCKNKIFVGIWPWIVLFWSSALWALPEIKLQKIAEGFTKPVYVASAKDGSGRLFVVEQKGVIRTINKDRKASFQNRGKIIKAPGIVFLDIRDKVATGVEKGLLSIAFHPRFRKNGRFFINYTTKEKGLWTHIAEYRIDPKAEQVDPVTEKLILKFRQPHATHNGGLLLFGPDGYLYTGSGDGGDDYDPHNNGQDLGNLLGTILRIDIDRQEKGRGYAVPKSNPFVGRQGARPEIFAYGLRNPWRFAIDPVTGHIFGGDVGQTTREEINLIERGKNYGWRIREGTLCTKKYREICYEKGLTPPLLDYGRDQGIAVVGGFVYRGKAYPPLLGIYFYGDFGMGTIWGFRYREGEVVDHREFLKTGFPIASFGEDNEGELYVVDYNGAVYKIAM